MGIFMTDLLRLAPSKAGAFQLSPVGVRVEGTPTLKDYEALLAWCGTVHGAIQWWIGDALVQGGDAHGELFSQLLTLLDVDERTLMQYEWVARNVPIENRHPPSTGVTYSHHREVATLKPSLQSRWLERAREGRWPVATLRRELKRSANGHDLTYWVLVRAENPEDAGKLMDEMTAQGRAAKIVEREHKAVT